MATLETRVPFTGFYESSHSDNIEHSINSYFDKEGDGDNHQPESLYFSFQNYGDIRRDYAKLYCKEFSSYFESITVLEISLEYKLLTSPREYNFTTDRIFADISYQDIKKIYRYTDKKILADTIKEQFTSRDGFSSFYSNSLESWCEKPLLQWDHNQLCTLLESALKTAGTHAIDDYDIMESALCNGCIDSIVYPYLSQWESEHPIEAIEEAIKRVLDISDSQWDMYSEEEKQQAMARYNDTVYHCSATLELPLFA